MKLIIISGLSGSGKSTALHTLEDLDYYCIDNLPAGMLPALASHLQNIPEPTRTNSAVGIDARNQTEDFDALPALVENLKTQGLDIEVWFLRADNTSLLKRYSETRRKHPLSVDGLSLADAIEREQELLDPIAKQADLYVDTTHTNIHQLRDLLKARVNDIAPDSFSLLFQSFGYKKGIPGDADFVFDVRCLPNPHWVPQLRPLTGKDPAVADFLGDDVLTLEMIDSLKTFLEKWLPRFRADNRSYMSVAIGCTGGQHRSVYMAETLAKHFSDSIDNTVIRHREMS